MNTYIFTFDVYHGPEEFYQQVVQAEFLPDALDKLEKQFAIDNDDDEFKLSDDNYAGIDGLLVIYPDGTIAELDLVEYDLEAYLHGTRAPKLMEIIK